MSKKRLIAIITIIVLLFAAGISVGVFLYGRGETQASDGSQTSDQDQVTDGNQSSDGTQTEENTYNPTTSDDENIVGTENNEAVENDNENANNDTADNNNVADNTNNTTNAGNNAGVTTDTNVDNVGETTISRVEEQERLISEDFLDWWQPMTVSVKPTEVGVELPQITVEKTATVNDKIDNLVYASQDITYIIAVTNNGETAVENIEITDRIPEKTTYVDGSIKDAFIVEIEDGKLATKTVEGAANSVITAEDVVIGLKWTVTIQAGETVFVSFKVNVNAEATGTILNTAIANGEESNETQTSIIKANKSSVVTRNDETLENKLAKVGDKITYTITVENTGLAEGKVDITDTVPAGTTLITTGLNVDEETLEITWPNVELPAATITEEGEVINGKAEVTFEVEVITIDGTIENVATVEDKDTNKDIIETADIKVEKVVSSIKRGEEYLDIETQMPEVKEGDVIEYTIIVTNTGSVKLTNVVADEKLTGIVIKGNPLKIGDLLPGESMKITATYTVTYEADIKGKGNREIYNEVDVSGETIPQNPDEEPEIVEDKDDETVPVAEDPRFEVVKTATQVKRVGETEFSLISGKVQSGDIVKYEIVVTNTGNTKLTNIVVTDTLNVRIDTENGEPKEVNPETGVSTLKTISTLVAGEKETIVTYYVVDEDDMTKDANELEIINNRVTAKPVELDEKQDDEIIYVNPYISRQVTKTWMDDENNKYATRPAQIKVRLYDDGEYLDVATITANQEGNWTHEFTMLPKYNEDGTVIVYTITEDDVNYYAENVPTTDMQEYTITNTLDQEKISVPVIKTWVDNNNNYNTRPSQITVRLYADGNEVQVATITAASVDQDGKWNHVFTNLPRYNGLGNEIVYTISEDDIADYDEDIDGYNITNTLNPAEKTSISGTKTWLDNNDKFGARPSKITVNLKIGQNVVNRQDVTADAKGEWKYSFTNLPTKDVNGNPITYKIQEEDVKYYTSEIVIPDEKNPNIVNITNELNQEYITLSGTKTWYAPSTVTIPSITVKVYQNNAQYMVNGTAVTMQLLPGNTMYRFDMLPKYSFTRNADGTIVQRTPNSYEVREDKPTDFQDPVYSTITKNGNSWVQNITNKWAQEYITIGVNKNWRDLGDASTRPTIYIDLYKKVGSAPEAKVATLTFNNNKTSDQFANLEKYTISQDGRTYTLNTYRVAERFDSSKYTSSGPSVTTPITSNTTVTFTNTLKQENTASITATKVWNIPTGATGATGIRIYVYQNGVRMDNQFVDLTYGGKTTYTFPGLPKYNFKADGTVELYTYTVKEEKEDGSSYEEYLTTQPSGSTTITNTAKGVVETITTEITTTSTSSPVDVVFVLDVSNSMKTKDNIVKMKDSVNNAIDTIMGYNNGNNTNRVGIVGFTSDAKKVKTETLLKLKHDINASVTYDPNYEKIDDYDGDKAPADGLLYSSDGQITVKGATYTQSGIERGAQMLINDTSLDKTGRTPILILVTDGEPTVYHTNYMSIGNTEGVSDSPVNYHNRNSVYYTILTANYWKTQIANAYHGLANIYTVGMDLDSDAAYATLQPTKSNIEKYSTSIRNWLKNNHGYNFDTNPNVANYADEAYLKNDLTTAELTNKLNSFINNSDKFKETSTKRMMTTSEITSRVVTLTNVDDSKPFTITCANGGPYTLDTALSAGIAVQNGTTVTVYLDRAGLTSQVYIKYYKKQ